jgi:hypothetical protein
LSSKGVLEAEFDTDGAVMNLYAVRPNGGVAMMHLDAGTEDVDDFGPDGKRESSIPLERPPITFFPMQIAVFRSGRDPDCRLAVSSRVQSRDRDLRSNRSSGEAVRVG